MTSPYFDDGQVTLYLGDCREIVPDLGLTADLVCTDPPYGETSLEWDRWVDGWVELAAGISDSMWCFGSMRMFLAWRDQFTGPGWKFSHERIWEKHNGTGFATDKFRCVHEHCVHWYQGEWRSQHHEVPRIAPIFDARDRTVSASAARLPHTGKIGAHRYEDDGTRLARSVWRGQSVRGGIAPTEKPVAFIDELIRYSCPLDGLVVDLFAGSGSTLEAARQCGRRAIGIEKREAQIEKAAQRLAQAVIA